jgi:hypothetical protein
LSQPRGGGSGSGRTAGHHVGTPDDETRSWGTDALTGGAAAAPVVINELRIHLPAAITEVVLGRLILDLERRIRRWRVENGHEHLEVSIHAGADDALVHTIAIDPHWLIESGPHPCTSDIPGDCWGWRLVHRSGDESRGLTVIVTAQVRLDVRRRRGPPGARHEGTLYQ